MASPVYKIDVSSPGSIVDTNGFEALHSGHGMRQWTGWIRQRFLHPWTTLTSAEISGSLGDLGTFLPLTIALVANVGLDLGTTLVFSGLYNIYSGGAFGVPMPVQPMKSIAAVAITEAGFNLHHTLLAGVIVSAVVFLLGVTNLVVWAQRIVPPQVIRGIQLGLGLKLAVKGIKMVLFEPTEYTAYRSWLGASGLITGCLATVYVLVSVLGRADAHTATSTSAPAPAENSSTQAPAETRSVVWARPASTASPQPVSATAAEALLRASSSSPSRSSAAPSGNPALPADAPAHAREPTEQADTGTSDARNGHAEHDTPAPGGRSGARVGSVASKILMAIPASVVLVLVGVVLALVAGDGVASKLRFGPTVPQLLRPAASEWLVAFKRGALPQLPLTLLNSVVSVVMLSNELFPETPMTAQHVAVSVGVMNLLGPWIGVMPCCHGAGGLAAQARFGARSGAAPMLLGAVKLVVGLVFGGSLFELLRQFPEPLLGVMLVASGAELATSAARIPAAEKRRWFLMLITAAGCFAKDTAVGFLVGWCASLIAITGVDWWASVQSKPSSGLQSSHV